MTNFMGIPFEHDGIDQGLHGNVKQWGMEKFQELVKPILEAGAAIRWTQYTPFFNDGDTCEFGVHDPRFHPSYEELSEADEDDYEDEGDYGDGFYDTYAVELEGGEETRYERRDNPPGSYRNGSMYNYVSVSTGRTFPRHPAYEHMETLARNMNHFESLLYDTFGDHAEITITPEKVIKESYEHE